MAKNTKDSAHYKKMQRSEKAIEKRVIRDLKLDVTVEDLEDVIVGLKNRIAELELELKNSKDRLKKAKKGLLDPSDFGLNSHIPTWEWDAEATTDGTATARRGT